MENLDWVFNIVATYAPKVILAVVTLIVGFWIVGRVVNVIGRGMEKRNIDPQLRPFLKSVLGVVLKIAVIISIASTLGIETTSFVAVLGAMGFAIGLALQGSLSNFAGGILILILKPFKNGDYISAMGYDGTVRETLILNTILKTVDNKTIILPNGPLAAAPITNFSTEDLRRVDMVFGIGYDDDIKLAKQILLDLANADERVLDEPAAPFVVVGELADSSVNFIVRLWCKRQDYFGIKFDYTEAVKAKFDEAGVSIPFPQRDVHLYEEKKMPTNGQAKAAQSA